MVDIKKFGSTLSQEMHAVWIKIMKRQCSITRSLIATSALLAVVASHVSTVSAAQEAPLSNAISPKASIFTSYGLMTTAFCDNQLDRLASQLATDYVQTDSQGHTVTRDALIKKLQDERNSILTIKTDYSITRWTPQANGVLVEMRMHSSGTGEKRVMFLKIRGTFTNDQIVDDLWVDTTSGWRIQSRQVVLDESHQQAA